MENFSDEVFTFKKSMLDRLQEIEQVLKSSGHDIPATEVRKEWQNFIEVAVEPSGWQAVWKVSRCLCEVLGVRYPLEVLGTVDQVDFQELTCTFFIEAVQDENVELPDKYEVPLIELWPTKAQENEALTVDLTAEAIDSLRYFYENIWMPWDETDSDETKDWATAHLLQRIHFHNDLTSKNMHSSLVSYARHLLSEIRYAARHKELIEADMTDEELETILGNEDVTYPNVAELMRLNFRINTIKNELIALENPVLRSYYEKIKFNGSHSGAESFKRVSLGLNSDDDIDQRKNDCFVIIPRSNVTAMINGLTKVKEQVGEKTKIQVRHSLQNLLDTCSKFKKIFLLSGDHFLIFSEYLYGDCEIVALEYGAVLKAKDNEKVLLTLDGKFEFDNVTFNCANVKSAIVVKGGEVLFKNCRFVGELQSNTSEAIKVGENAKAVFENCAIENFSTGILALKNGAVKIENTNFINCGIGIDGVADCAIECKNATFHDNDYGIFLETNANLENNKSISIHDDLSKIKNLKEFKLDTMKFISSKKANIRVISANKWNALSELNKNKMEDDAGAVSA